MGITETTWGLRVKLINSLHECSVYRSTIGCDPPLRQRPMFAPQLKDDHPARSQHDQPTIGRSRLGCLLLNESRSRFHVLHDIAAEPGEIRLGCPRPPQPARAEHGYR